MKNLIKLLAEKIEERKSLTVVRINDGKKHKKRLRKLNKNRGYVCPECGDYLFYNSFTNTFYHTRDWFCLYEVDVYGNVIFSEKLGINNDIVKENKNL